MKKNMKSIYKTYKNAKLICFSNKIQRMRKDKNWLNKKVIDYSLTMQQVIDEGYINPNYIGFDFECFVEKLLKELKLENIEKDVAIKTNQRIMRTDFVVGNNKRKIIIEVKSYRSKYIQNTIIKQAVEQVEYYKDVWKKVNGEEVQAVLIISCLVPDEIKETYYKEREIIIIDIANLLYLIQRK